MHAQYGTVLNAKIKRSSWGSQEGYGSFMISGVNSLFIDGEFVIDGDLVDHDSLVFEIQSSEGWQHVDFSFGSTLKSLPFIVKTLSSKRVEQTGYSDKISGYCSQKSNTLSKSVLTLSDYVYEYPTSSIGVSLEAGDAVYMSDYLEDFRGIHKYWDNVFFVNETRTYTSRDDIFSSRVLTAPIDYDEKDLSIALASTTIESKFENAFSTSHTRGINPFTPNPIKLDFPNVTDRQMKSLVAWCESFCGYKAKEVYIKEVEEIKQFFLDSFSIEFKDFNINNVSISLLPDLRSTI